MKTIVGLYDDLADARAVVDDLVNSGYDRNDISLVAADTDSKYSDRLKKVDYDDTNETGEAAAEGAVAGGAIGGLAGVLIGLGALAIPGLGPVVAAGPIVAGLVGAGIGAAGGGLIGALVEWGLDQEEAGYYVEGVRRGGTLVVAKAADNVADQIVSVMNRHNPIDIDQRAEVWRQEGWTGYTADTDIDRERHEYAAPRSEVVTDRETTIPVTEEELHVGKREVQKGGVRVRSHIEETPVEEQVRLRDEEIHVERRPVNRPVTDADRDLFEEKSIEMTETDEEVVASKQARVKEEVVVGKDVRENVETVRDTVRHTVVDVEPIALGEEIDYDEAYTPYRNDFRSHYSTNYGNTDYEFNDYEPAYYYGYSIGSHENYRDRDWNDIRPDIRRRWEERNQGTWEDYEDAVRHGWDRTRRGTF